MAQSASRPAARAHPTRDRSTLYEEITDRIIAQLEAGRLPWVQPWGSSGVRAPLGLPRNAATGRAYGGINVLILWDAVVEQGYATQSWLTFRQSVALGGHVRKGERGTTVVYADRFVPDDVRDRARERGEQPRGIPFLKRFTVFNVEQCQGLPDGIAAPPPDRHDVMYVAERAGPKNVLVGRADPDEETAHEAELMLRFILGAGHWPASSVQSSLANGRSVDSTGDPAAAT